MSVQVLSQVLRHSTAEVGSRLVMIALADAAYHDGITWLPQEEIAARTRLNRTHVNALIKERVEAGELEVRKAQRGRRRVNVYRVMMPGVERVDYERLPFAVSEPFSTTSDLQTSPTSDDVGSTAVTTSDPQTSPNKDGRKGIRKGKPPPVAADAAPPRIEKVDGRHPVIDAVAKVCGIRPGSPREREAAVAVNGSATITGIAAQEWALLTPETREAYTSGTTVTSWSERLRLRVEWQAREYGKRLPGAVLSPLALAKYWTDHAPPGARRADAAPPAACSECGVGGGLHAADCSQAGGREPSEATG